MNTMKGNKELTKIMQTAWTLVKKNGFTLSEALRCAWANFRLYQSMKARIVRFHFRKVDGTIREAFGTLQDSIVPTSKESTRTRKSSDEVQVYFDTEKSEYRSFKMANLISIA